MSQIDFLQTMCNKYGDFKVAYSFKDKNENIIWSKHRSVLECWHSENGLFFLSKANHRQILPFEIVLDVDNEPSIEKFNDICKQLKDLKVKFYAYSTGSKGYHIHCIYEELAFCSENERKKIREFLITSLKCDSLKISGNVLIAMENIPHWKTGKIKTLLIKNE